MSRRRYRDDHRNFYAVAGAVVDRTLAPDTQSVLRMLPGQPVVYATGFGASMDWEDRTTELEAFVERTFDAWLYFDNSGPRQVGFRVPLDLLPEAAVRPYAADDDSSEGLVIETTDADLLLRFRLDGADNELFNLGETGDRWLDHVLAVRAELLSGTRDALELGRLIGEYGDRVEPGLPAEYGLSAAARNLAAYLLIAPEILARRSADRTETDATGPRNPPDDWLSDRTDRIPVARWEFAAADPGKSFQIRLGRLADSCEYGSWYVTATETRGTPLAFHTEDEARRGYHDEALRLQRLNDPGRWRQLEPD